MSLIFIFHLKKVNFTVIIVIVVCFSLVTNVLGDESNPIIFNQIKKAKASEPFTVTGSITGSDCKMVGLEIYPKSYWEKAIFIAETRKAKGFRFSLLSVVQSITDEGVSGNDQTFWGVFLHVFNPDGTIAYQSAPPCPDHRIHFAPVIKNSNEEKTWCATFNTDKDHRKLIPGVYELLIWDATDQSFYVNTHIENVYDPKNHKIYPSTKKGSIWDAENQKDLICAIFELN